MGVILYCWSLILTLLYGSTPPQVSHLPLFCPVHKGFWISAVLSYVLWRKYIYIAPNAHAMLIKNCRWQKLTISKAQLLLCCSAIFDGPRMYHTWFAALLHHCCTLTTCRYSEGLVRYYLFFSCKILTCQPLFLVNILLNTITM